RNAPYIICLITDWLEEQIAQMARRQERYASPETAQSVKLHISKAKQDFTGRWGQGGAKRTELLTLLHERIEIARQAFTAVFEPGSPLHDKVRHEIQLLHSCDSLRSYAARLGESLSERVEKRWLDVCKQLTDAL